MPDSHPEYNPATSAGGHLRMSSPNACAITDPVNGPRCSHNEISPTPPRLRWRFRKLVTVFARPQRQACVKYMRKPRQSIADVGRHRAVNRCEPFVIGGAQGSRQLAMVLRTSERQLLTRAAGHSRRVAAWD